MKSTGKKSKPDPLLLPCPFCGLATNVIYVASQDLCECEDEKTEGWHAICDATRNGCGSGSGWSKTKNGAAKLWNARMAGEKLAAICELDGCCQLQPSAAHGDSKEAK